MSLQVSLYNKIQEEGYVSRDNLRLFARQLNYDSATADRKLRNLTEKGNIKPKFNKSFIVGYSYKNQFYDIYEEEIKREPIQEKLLK